MVLMSPDPNTDADSAGNAGDSTDDSTEGTDNTGSQEAAPTPDSVTGLITQADGTLIDPNTGRHGRP